MSDRVLRTWFDHDRDEWVASFDGRTVRASLADLRHEAQRVNPIAWPVLTATQVAAAMQCAWRRRVEEIAPAALAAAMF